MSYVTHADLGGQLSHGAVMPEPEGELFHAAWEPRAFALTLAMGAVRAWNLDMSRAARETLPEYAALSYYEVWVAGLQKLLEERGMLDRAEMAAARALLPPVAVARVLAAADVGSVLAAGAPTERATSTRPRWHAGDHVRARSEVVNHHTRLPGYVRGKRGIIERAHGAHVFADAHAQGLGEQPQWLYTVVFDAIDLWPDAAPGHTVSVDAWEPYLEAA
jgi:nitrile hydratase beta subunit